MPFSKARRLAVCVALVAGLALAASAAEILIADAKSQPESLTMAPGTKPVQRHTALRSFDLENGTPKIRWNLPGDTIWIAERGAGKAVSIPCRNNCSKQRSDGSL
jgi:hypothetical protein